MKKEKLLNTFDIVQIVGLIVCVVLQAIVSGDFEPLAMIAAIAGVINIVLICKANLWNFLFGFITVTSYAIVAFMSGNYGVALMNGLILMPMQFHGFFQWRKRGADLQIENGEASLVDARRMSWKMRGLVATGCIVIILIVALVLKCFDATAPLPDATSTVMNVAGQILMNFAFMEQYFLWIIVNISSVVMWSVSTAHGDPQGPIMIIMWSFYLINSIYGLRNWLSFSKK